MTDALHVPAIQERQERMERNMAALKSFIEQSGDSPRSVVKMEALYRYALEELADAMELIENLRLLVMEEGRQHLSAQLDLAAQNRADFERLIESYKQEREEGQKDKVDLLRLYRSVYQCLQKLGSGLEQQAADMSLRLTMVGDEAASSVMEVARRARADLDTGVLVAVNRMSDQHRALSDELIQLFSEREVATLGANQTLDGIVDLIEQRMGQNSRTQQWTCVAIGLGSSLITAALIMLLAR